jgi:Asp-tRNA(Asn)/Glu-tRNA(Gln) amidotransferase A subunit family amidase
VFKDRIADPHQPHVERLFDDGGAVPVGLTTASEFGGLNVSVTKLNGVTHNPWQHGRTVGGPSGGGAAAAVAGGLVSLATGGDGGGSIRIPAGYTGLLGMKGTFGRITRGPRRLRPPQHRGARQPVPLGARRRPLLRRVRRHRPATRPASRRRAPGRPASAPTT